MIAVAVCQRPPERHIHIVGRIRRDLQGDASRQTLWLGGGRNEPSTTRDLKARWSIFNSTSSYAHTRNLIEAAWSAALSRWRTGAEGRRYLARGSVLSVLPASHFQRYTDKCRAVQPLYCPDHADRYVSDDHAMSASMKGLYAQREDASARMQTSCITQISVMSWCEGQRACQGSRWREDTVGLARGAPSLCHRLDPVRRLRAARSRSLLIAVLWRCCLLP